MAHLYILSWFAMMIEWVLLGFFCSGNGKILVHECENCVWFFPTILCNNDHGLLKMFFEICNWYPHFHVSIYFNMVFLSFQWSNYNIIFFGGLVCLSFLQSNFVCVVVQATKFCQVTCRFCSFLFMLMDFVDGTFVLDPNE
jgi:hypothetical protein